MQAEHREHEPDRPAAAGHTEAGHTEAGHATVEDRHVRIGADREPTPAEEEVAERVELDEGVAGHFQEMTKLGAAVKGEGEI